MLYVQVSARAHARVLSHTLSDGFSYDRRSSYSCLAPDEINFLINFTTEDVECLSEEHGARRAPPWYISTFRAESCIQLIYDAWHPASMQGSVLQHGRVLLQQALINLHS
jgi:hypothetical protein